MTGPATYASPVHTTTTKDQRPTAPEPTHPEPIRHFNTSRTLKAVGDTSTIDFAYFPTDLNPTIEETFRVPILPTNTSTSYRNTPSNTAHESEDATTVMKPEISTMSADAVFLPMADMSDGHAMNVDFHAMADKVAANLKRMSVPVEEQAGIMKQLWNDMVDDMLGSGKKKVT